MTQNRLPSIRSTCILILVTMFASSLGAQGTKADYERAGKLREVTRNRVVAPRVQPQWFAENTRFWYRRNLTEGRREFVVVDTVTGSRQPAFDHVRLAEWLGEAMKTKIDPERLPIESLDFDSPGGGIRLLGRGGPWQLDPETGELEKIEAKSGNSGNGDFLDEARASRGGGEEIHIEIVNRSEGPLELSWVNPGGGHQVYGKIGSGKTRDQHTFQRHVWIAKDTESGRRAIFEAGFDGERVIISDENLVAAPKPKPRTGGASGRRSPDGRWAVNIENHNVVVRSAGGEGKDVRKSQQLTTDGISGHAYQGRSWWAPDSKKFVVMKRRDAQEQTVRFVESSPEDQVQPKWHGFQYLKPGDRIAVSKPHLFVEVNDGQFREVEIDDTLFPTPWSLSDLTWMPDSRSFCFLYNQRGHQALRIVAVDSSSGESRVLIEETSPTFIDYAGKRFSRHLPESEEWLWMSERDGWNHLYLYDAGTGKVKHQVTRGEWVVRGVDRVDVDNREIWFRAGGIHPDQDPYHVHYCRVNFDGSDLVILTEGDGTHSVEFSPDRRHFLATWSRVDHPPVVELRRSSDGKRLGEIERGDWSALLETGWQIPERWVAKGRDGKTDIHGVIFRPTTFDPDRAYPVIEKIYAGPHGAHVPKAFSAYHSAQFLAELGFVVVQIDGMGTSHRSKAFHDVAWKNLKDAGFPDRIRWMRSAAKAYPYLDLDHVGIYGGSAGGQNAMAALLWHGDFYRVAVADCGCHDNRMDKIWWNELWMGWPVDESYEANSNVVNAHLLRGKLLLTVGELDRNVDPASTMQVVGALIRAKKDFDFLPVPGAGHGVGDGSPYLIRRRADFFVRHLLGVEPRDR